MRSTRRASSIHFPSRSVKSRPVSRGRQGGRVARRAWSDPTPGGPIRGRDLSDDGSEAADALRAEAGPVLAVGLDDRSLEVTEGEDVVTGLIVEADVHGLVRQAGTVEGLLGGLALDAGGLGVEG